MIFLCAFGLSLLAVLALTPAVRSLAKRLRFLDYPSKNKVHLSPTPLMGGIAVALASLAAAAASLALIRCPYSARIVGFMSGGLMVVVLGLADDANGMRPRAKFLGQTAAAAVMLLSGGIDGIPLPAPLAFVLALFWMVGLMNAFNFLDNMDGITAGLSAIATLGIFVLAVGHGQTNIAIAAVAVAGGALGFLWYNFAPASIFLGDAGSLFLGYVVGGLSLRAVAYTDGGLSALLIPVLMLGYPIFDALLVMAARYAEGRDLAQGGCDHSSHRIARLGLTSGQTAVVIYLISALLTSVAVYLSLFQSGRPVLTVLVALAAASGMTLLGVRLFRVPVARAAADAPASMAATGSTLCEPQEDDLLVLNLPSGAETEAPTEPVPADSPSRETVEAR
jgi:UDP-GlcNAc:undecaprenyl-phosphate GlcNAc-1-phosphate transferase